MTNDDLENIEVTRTLLSRLLGQTHEPAGKTYSSLLMCLKLLGRRASKLTSKWNEPILDEELRTELVKLLKHIRDTPILFQDRAIIPKDHRLVKLNLSGDGSEPGASNTLHALSMSNIDKSLVSRLVMASQKLGNFSVPIHELLGTLKSVSSADKYISCIPELLNCKETLILSVFLDSMCPAASLSPHKTYKSTTPRNLTIKIHLISKALCSKKPSLQIFFAHLASASLPADLNSKKVEKPLEVCNSELWRRGPDEYFELGPP